MILNDIIPKIVVSKQIELLDDYEIELKKLGTRDEEFIEEYIRLAKEAIRES